MLAYAELRDHLIQFLSGDLPLDGFEDWFVQRSWNMHKDSGLSAQRLAYAVELRLAEYGQGHLADQQLRQEFRDLLNSTVFFSQPDVVIETGSSVGVVTALPWQSQFVDKPLSRAS